MAPKLPERRYNPKRELAQDVPVPERDALRGAVAYGGNPAHKRNPGDFGLTPPAQPRPDKTLCDQVEIFERAVAVDCLRRGIERGLISRQRTGKWPQNIWSMTARGEPVEAQLENAELGTYHAYPLPESDPFGQVVRNAWSTNTP